MCGSQELFTWGGWGINGPNDPLMNATNSVCDEILWFSLLGSRSVGPVGYMLGASSFAFLPKEPCASLSWEQTSCKNRTSASYCHQQQPNVCVRQVAMGANVWAPQWKYAQSVSIKGKSYLCVE